MIKYISILRGINVGGKRKVLMKDLKMLYEQLGFTKLISYIQSGNVLLNVQHLYSLRHTLFQDVLRKEFEN